MHSPASVRGHRSSEEAALPQDQSAVVRWPVTATGGRPSLGEIGLNQFVPYLMNRIMARWNSTIADELKPLDLTTANLRILAVLSVMPALTINELTIYAVSEQSTTSRTVDAMEAQGWVRRTPRPGDMRVRDVTITEAGRTILEQGWPVLYDNFESLMDGVSDDELRGLVATLHKMLRNIRQNDL
jgi:DNA-binding MarR family transcriptional regulator